MARVIPVRRHFFWLVMVTGLLVGQVWGEIVTVHDASTGLAAKYLSGFAIPANTTVVWNCTDVSVVNGAITFTDKTSVLKLSRDLYLGARGTLVAKEPFIDAGFITIDGNGKRIVLGGDVSLAKQSWINVMSNLTIEGNGISDDSHTLTCSKIDSFVDGNVNPFAAVPGVVTVGLTLKNLNFDFENFKRNWSIFFCNLTLDEVRLRGLHAQENRLMWRGSLVVKSNVSFESNIVWLAGDVGHTPVTIDTGATLTVGAQCVLYTAAEPPKQRLCTVVNKGTVINNNVLVNFDTFVNIGTLTNQATTQNADIYNMGIMALAVDSVVNGVVVDKNSFAQWTNTDLPPPQIFTRITFPILPSRQIQPWYGVALMQA